MKIVAISDTHNQHESLTLPPGDVLVHAGDATMDGGLDETLDFMLWMSRQPFEHKIFVPGNHDMGWDKTRQHRSAMQEGVEFADRGSGVIVLIDKAVQIGGLKFYGSPWIPEIGRWGFMHPRNSQAARDHWAGIPAGVDVLVTHTPPHGVLDHISKEEPAHLGDECLRERLIELDLEMPHHHIFGHIHEQGGRTFFGSYSRWYNAAVLDGDYKLAHEPTVITL